jgi:hypothetical protein
MDLITRLPCTARGHTAIVVFVDRLTKMVLFAPNRDTVSVTTKRMRAMSCNIWDQTATYLLT